MRYPLRHLQNLMPSKEINRGANGQMSTTNDLEFTIRRKVFQLFGASFHIYKADGSLLGFSKQKAFKLKEDIRIFTDESATVEKLRITARAIIDFSAAYDVVESSNNAKLGALQRKGWTSLVRDTWQVLDANDREVGQVLEDSSFLSILRRFVDWASWIPQTFHLYDANKKELARFKTHFNPFVHRMTVTVMPDCPLHPLMVLASGVLLMAIEGRQT